MDKELKEKIRVRDEKVFKKWKHLYPKITKEQSLICESMAFRELNGRDRGALHIYMYKNGICV